MGEIENFQAPRPLRLGGENLILGKGDLGYNDLHESP